MIRINLLPFRAARKKENVRRQVSIFLLSIILVTGGLFYYNIVLNSKLAELTKKVETTRVALNSKKKQAAEVDKIQKELEILKKKTEVIVSLALNRKDAVLLIDSMAKLVVEKRMWFTNLEAKVKSVDIRGIALDNKTVADFMTKLETSPFFHGVRLQSTKRQKIGEYDNLKSFVVTMDRKTLSDIAKEQAKQSENMKKS